MLICSIKTIQCFPQEKTLDYICTLLFQNPTTASNFNDSLLGLHLNSQPKPPPKTPLVITSCTISQKRHKWHDPVIESQWALAQTATVIPERPVVPHMPLIFNYSPSLSGTPIHTHYHLYTTRAHYTDNGDYCCVVKNISHRDLEKEGKKKRQKENWLYLTI